MQRPRFVRARLGAVVVSVGVLVALTIVGCGGGGGGGGQGTGLVTVRLSDPPTCVEPVGPFHSVWVTVTRVQAHVSPNAAVDDPGWIDLADLRAHPIQVDLLSGTSSDCFLATLGATAGLPPGLYQQIRLSLLSNNPVTGEAIPSPNQCDGTGGFNCLDHVAVGGLERLEVGFGAIVGLEIGPAQIAGGGINLVAGEATEINIDFDACQSLIQDPDGSWRLKPTLRAGAISVNHSILGRVVDSLTTLPITGGVIIVQAQQPDAGGIDRVIAQTLASPRDGTFLLCPLPPGDYDIVASAVAGGVAYGVTVLFTVPAGTDIGDVAIIPQFGPTPAPALLSGLVTTTSGLLTETSADVSLTAFQSATPPGGGGAILFTVPVFPGSTPLITTIPGAFCPIGAECANWTLVVPPMNPSIAVWTGAPPSFSAPSSSLVLYTVEGRAFVPDGSGVPDCFPPAGIQTALDVFGVPISVLPGVTTTAATLAFQGCTGGF